MKKWICGNRLRSQGCQSMAMSPLWSGNEKESLMCLFRWRYPLCLSVWLKDWMSLCRSVTPAHWMILEQHVLLYETVYAHMHEDSMCHSKLNWECVLNEWMNETINGIYFEQLKKKEKTQNKIYKCIQCKRFKINKKK